MHYGFSGPSPAVQRAQNDIANQEHAVGGKARTVVVVGCAFGAEVERNIPRKRLNTVMSEKIVSTSLVMI